MTAPKPVVLVVIDGLTPSMFEAGDTPALRFLAEHGEYRRAASVFPSLTPVCLASLATGAYPDVHEIPHLVWWHRGEQRLVEYGSAFRPGLPAGAHTFPPGHKRPPPPQPPRPHPPPISQTPPASGAAHRAAKNALYPGRT